MQRTSKPTFTMSTLAERLGYTPNCLLSYLCIHVALSKGRTGPERGPF